jgi:hypothetical protein
LKAQRSIIRGTLARDADVESVCVSLSIKLAERLREVAHLSRTSRSSIFEIALVRYVGKKSISELVGQVQNDGACARRDNEHSRKSTRRRS